MLGLVLSIDFLGNFFDIFLAPHALGSKGAIVPCIEANGLSSLEFTMTEISVYLVSFVVVYC